MNAIDRKNSSSNYIFVDGNLFLKINTLFLICVSSSFIVLYKEKSMVCLKFLG